MRRKDGDGLRLHRHIVVKLVMEKAAADQKSASFSAAFERLQFRGPVVRAALAARGWQK